MKVSFFIEHWLGEEESDLFSKLSDQHSILFDADFSCADRYASNKNGRPHGGLCWVIRNNLRIIEYANLSKSLSRVAIEDLKGSRVSIFGIWQPFDDGSIMKYSILQSNLSMLSAEPRDLSGEDVMIMGDFNADFSRGKRFDKTFSNFMSEHNFTKIVDLTGVQAPTYRNKNCCAVIDHIFSNSSLIPRISDFCVLQDALDVSDHCALSCVISEPLIGMGTEILCRKKNKKFNKFPWEKREFVDAYSNILCHSISEHNR